MAFEIRTHQPKKIERNTNYVKTELESFDEKSLTQCQSCIKGK